MFNLQKYSMIKQANYDGIQGYWVAQTRAWQNCVGCKQKSGEAAQKAWQECLDEYQKGDGRLEWVADYASDEIEKIRKSAQHMRNDYLAYGDKIKQKSITPA